MKNRTAKAMMAIVKIDIIPPCGGGGRTILSLDHRNGHAVFKEQR
jgi:hypothetical protein